MHFDTRYIEEAITFICINRYITIRNIYFVTYERKAEPFPTEHVRIRMYTVVVHNRVHL